jgi:eukaryotic-like serine/threonine-protein kinase
VTSPETAVPAVNRLGQVISGRYLIRELLGEGGMGSVYLAEHTHMKKRVALKLLHPEMSDNAEVSARFEREAMASSHIEHPNVAAATDFGKTDDGAFFLVLEYVEGTDLRAALEKEPISVARCLRITRQIALALERAHEAGIVHRDLKPENVMLVKKDDEPDFVKVLDFGIAKILEGAAQHASAEIAARGGGAAQPLTRLGTILGTPEYMAPEQALGEPVTPAADLYGVGVILYEMLTGKHPFDPPDRMAMLSFHIVAPVPPMHDRAPDREIPALVEAVARCLLEKDSKKRYPNARALIDAIDAAGAANGIEVGGTPSALPSYSGGSPGSATGREAFAQTAVGVPPPDLTTGALSPSPGLAVTNAAKAPVSGLLHALGQQPRRVLYVLAAAAPLALILVVVLAVLALRGPSTTAGNGSQGPRTETPAAKAAPADRVKAAVALGPEALEALAKEFPEDPSLQKELALAYSASGKSVEAMRAVRALLAADPSAAGDDAVAELVASTAAKAHGDADDEAFAILEGPLGERGVDVLIELTAKGAGKEIRELRARATKSLAKPEVRAHASPAASVLLDMKAAQSCGAKRELMPRLKESGDARVLPYLKGLKPTSGCGFLGRRDCWSCLRKGAVLDDAITAVETRSTPK